ncbi:MAG: Crp/Fnr family transcriptional regulator [Rhodomicrobium sp.]
MESLERILKEHPFFAKFEPDHLQLLTGCAKNYRFAAGEFMFREGESADVFYLIRHGKVALEIVSPGIEPIIIETLRDGDIVGASWLIPPYRWTFDGRTTEMTRAIGLDAACLRDKAEADHHLGYVLMKSFLPILVRRLQATRMQIIDNYRRP